MGRFMTPDPIGIASGDANLFRYVSNNPVSHIDPNGLLFQDIVAKHTTPAQQAAIGGASVLLGAYLVHFGLAAESTDIGVSAAIAALVLGGFAIYEGGSQAVKAAGRTIEAIPFENKQDLTPGLTQEAPPNSFDKVDRPSPSC